MTRYGLLATGEEEMADVIEGFCPAEAKKRLRDATEASYKKSTVRLVKSLETDEHFSYVLCTR